MLKAIVIEVYDELHLHPLAAFSLLLTPSNFAPLWGYTKAFLYLMGSPHRNLSPEMSLNASLWSFLLALNIFKCSLRYSWKAMLEHNASFSPELYCRILTQMWCIKSYFWVSKSQECFKCHYTLSRYCPFCYYGIINHASKAQSILWPFKSNS